MADSRASKSAASTLEDAYAKQLREAGITGWTCQCKEPYVVTRQRSPRSRPRADFCWTAEKLVVEIDGIGSRKNSHTSYQGYTRNMRKMNDSHLDGWVTLRFTGDMVKKETTAIEQTKQMLEVLRAAL